MALAQNDDLSFESLRQDFDQLSWATFRADLLAGLSVALVALPQSMAFSLVAGLPFSCGLLAAIFGTAIAAFFGASRHLVVGPNTAIAIMLQFGTSEILFNHFRGVQGDERVIVAVQILTLLTLLVGLVQFFVAVFRLGRLTQFISYSVVVGYLAGTAVAVVVNQMGPFFGISLPYGVSSLYDKGLYLITHVGSVHAATACVGAFSLAILFLMKRLKSKIPGTVVMLVVVTGLLYVFQHPSMFFEDPITPFLNVTLVGEKGKLTGVMPYFSMPYFDRTILTHLFPTALAIGLLGILETSSVAKSVASRSGQRLSINQQILGLGVGNLFSSFIGAMPSAGSPVRSSMLIDLGGRSRLAAVMSGGIVWLMVWLFSPAIALFPIPALSAILIMSACSILNPRELFLCLKATRSDAIVLAATFLACVFFTLDVAFFLGIALSITFYLQKAAVPNLVECTYDDTGRLSASSGRNSDKLIRVINVQGELFFGAADIFQATLKSMAEDDTSTQVIILRLKNARDIDATACLAIDRLYEFLRLSGRYLLACGLSYPTWEVLCDAGLVEKIGKKNLFVYDPSNPRKSLQKALSRSKNLIAAGKTSPRPAIEPLADNESEEKISPQEVQI